MIHNPGSVPQGAKQVILGRSSSHEKTPGFHFGSTSGDPRASPVRPLNPLRGGQSPQNPQVT